MNSKSKSGNFRFPLPLFLIIAAGLILRIIFVFQIRQTPVFDFLASDTGDFEKFALEILEGRFLSRETVYFNPFYPFFLTGIYFIFGHHPFLVLIVQALLDTGTCLLLYFFSIKLFGQKRIGWLAAGIYAGYGISIFYTGIMVGVIPSNFLFLSAACLFLSAARKGSNWLWLTGGVVFGISALLRPNVLFVIPFLLIWAFSHPQVRIAKVRFNFRPPLQILAGFILIIAPFSVRHYLITETFSLPFGNGGFNFYVGNHHGASGTYTYLKGISNSPAGQIKSSVRQASKALGENVSLTRASAYWFNRGMDYIKRHPLEYVSLLGRKFLLFWNAQEIGQNIDYYFSRRFSDVLSLPLLSFGIIAPFAWIGFICAAVRRPRGVIFPAVILFSYMMSIIIFFISARYRLPSLPFIIIFSAYGLNCLIETFLQKKPARILFSVLGLAGAFIVVNLPLNPVDEEEYLSWSHNMLGNVYQEQGNITRAIREFKKAIVIDPDNSTAHDFLGNAYRKSGRFREAVGEYRASIRLNPDNAPAHNNLGVVYAEQGMMSNAFHEFQTALRIDPDFGEAHSNLAVYYFYYGSDIQAARVHAEQAVADGYQIPEKLRNDLQIRGFVEPDEGGI